MKRRSITLLLALAMCLSLLSACGGDSAQNTEEPSASASAASPTVQPAADGKDEQPSQEPEETEPEESVEPTPEPTEEPDSPTAAFLELLQDEYDNGGPLWGHSANHVCVKLPVDAFADGEDIFVNWDAEWYRYNTVTKELSEPLAIGEPDMYVDGLFYRYDRDEKKISAYDKTGALAYNEELGEDWDSINFDRCALFERGFVVCGNTIKQDGYTNTLYTTYTTFSYDLKERHMIPMPEKDVGHGIKEAITDVDKIFSVDGGAYGISQNYDGSNTSAVYKLNTGTWEWEEFDTVDDDGRYRITGTNAVYETFYGRYVYSKQGIFDILTGEQVFTFDKQYPAPHWYTRNQNYIADRGVYIIWTNTHQLVDLHSSGVSEEWARPKKYDDMAIIDETYVVYWDDYGCFLWNALDGTEETIMLFEK